MKTNKLFQRGRKWLLMLLLLAGSMAGYAQSDCFEYEDDGKTITGLTQTGLAKSSLTIPATVTKVNSEAFSSTSAQVSGLIIEAGGNPEFASGLFRGRTNPLRDIQILGNSMTVENISKLFTSLGAQDALSTVYIEGYSGEWSDIEETGVLASDVSVTMPAALVTTQQFGAAKVYGRFIIEKEIITFCGNVTFEDTDHGSHMLFYVADYRAEDSRLHIQRVKYVKQGKGVLIHNIKNTSTYADLLRYNGVITGADESLYAKNMLVGVTEQTTIESTDGTKTNYILKDGAFHPTSGGTVKANKAYLQIPTNAAREMLTISFEDETTGVAEVRWKMEDGRGEAYDLQGRKVAQPTKGLYIKNGKKYIIR